MDFQTLATIVSSCGASIHDRFGLHHAIITTKPGRGVSSFPLSVLGKGGSYSGRVQSDQVYSFSAPINWVFNIGGINCDPNVSFFDILRSLAKIALQGNVPNAIQVNYWYHLLALFNEFVVAFIAI